MAGLAQEPGIRRVIGKHAELESDGREKATIIPVRCFSCGNLIGDKWEDFAKRVKAGEVAGKVLDDLGLTRYCCRRMLLSHVEIIDEIIEFYEKGNVENEEETA